MKVRKYIIFTIIILLVITSIILVITNSLTKDFENIRILPTSTPAENNLKDNEVDNTIHNYIYKGENEFFTAELNIVSSVSFIEEDGRTKFNGFTDKVLTVTYKKDISELTTVKSMEIKCLCNSCACFHMGMNFNDNNIKEKSYKVKSSGNEFYNQDTDYDYKVNINLDGNLQTIDLINVQ